MINQLFIRQPPTELIIECLSILGFQDLYDKAVISKTCMEYARVVDMIKLKKPELQTYYANNKAIKYLTNLDIKKCITIVRQLLKTIGYDLISKEKMSYGKKDLCYRIVTLENKKRIKNKMFVKPIILRFR